MADPFLQGQFQKSRDFYDYTKIEKYSIIKADNLLLVRRINS